MNVVRGSGTIDRDGQLHILLPTGLRPGKVELAVVIKPMRKRSAKRRKYDFSHLVGKLRWSGDAVAAQREMRNEW